MTVQLSAIPKAALRAIGITLVGNIMIYLMARATGVINSDIIVEGHNQQVTLGVVVTSTLVATIGGAFIFAGFVKFNPTSGVRWYQILGAIAVVLSLGLPLIITDPDATLLFFLTLNLMHVVAGVTMLWLLPKYSGYNFSKNLG